MFYKYVQELKSYLKGLPEVLEVCVVCNNDDTIVEVYTTHPLEVNEVLHKVGFTQEGKVFKLHSTENVFKQLKIYVVDLS